jgi:hypothetical protein
MTRRRRGGGSAAASASAAAAAAANVSCHRPSLARVSNATPNLFCRTIAKLDTAQWLRLRIVLSGHCVVPMALQACRKAQSLGNGEGRGRCQPGRRFDNVTATVQMDMISL